MNRSIFVPNDPGLRQRLLELHHDDPMGGHYGVAKTYNALKRKYYWTNIFRQCSEYVATCDRCQRITTRRHKPYGNLTKLPEAERPMQELSMDLITGLPPAWSGEEVVDAIMVVVDRFSKFVRYFAVPIKHDGRYLADKLAPEFFTYGLPDGIVTDRDPRYIGNFWSNLCYHLHIEQRKSTAFHPQTDGSTERHNQELEHYLRCYTNYHCDDWPMWLRLAEFAYNNSIHKVTRRTPVEVLFRWIPKDN